MSKRLAEWDQIRELAFYGLPCSAISQKVKLDVNKVSQCIIRMRRKGYLPAAKKNQNPLEKKKSIISSYQSTGIKRGCLGQIIENLTEDQIHWLDPETQSLPARLNPAAPAPNSLAPETHLTLLRQNPVLTTGNPPLHSCSVVAVLS